MSSPQAAPVVAIHVDNGTQGGTVSEGTPVTLSFYQDAKLLKQVSAVTDAAGDCVVEDVPAQTNVVAVAQAKHGNMNFSSAPLPLAPGLRRHELSVRVFDISHDGSLIRAGTHHLIIKAKGPDIHVDEYVQLVNDSDKAVLSNRQDADGNYCVVEMSLPENFTNLSFSDYFHPNAVVQTETGFYDTMAMPPGSYNAVFSYDVPAQSTGLQFSKQITFDTGRMMLFVQNPPLTASGLGSPVGSMTLQDGVSVDYYTVDAPQGSVLQFRLDGLDKNAAVNAPPQNMWIVLGTIFAVVLALALYRFVKLG